MSEMVVILTSAQAAKWVKRGDRTIRRWIALGLLPATDAGTPVPSASTTSPRRTSTSANRASTTADADAETCSQHPN